MLILVALKAAMTSRPPTAPPATIAELRAELTALQSDVARLKADRADELARTRTVEDLTPAHLRKTVVTVAERHGLSPRLLAAVAWVETGGTWDPQIRGAAGEVGLTQVLPVTARWIAQARGIPLPDLTDAETNLDWGAWYLARLIEEAKGDVTEGLRRYNAGGAWRERAPEAARGYSRRVTERMGALDSHR